MVRIRLADDWARLHRRSTVIAASVFAFIAALGSAVVDAWSILPPDLKSALPDGAARWVSSGSFLLLIFFRYTKISVKKNADTD